MIADDRLRALVPVDPALVRAALHQGAAGDRRALAALALLDAGGWPAHRTWTILHLDYRPGADGGPDSARVADWTAAVAWALDHVRPYGAGGSVRLLQLAASVAAGVPVDLGQALADLDTQQTADALAALALIRDTPSTAAPGHPR